MTPPSSPPPPPPSERAASAEAHAAQPVHAADIDAHASRRRAVVAGPFEFHPIVFPASGAIILALVLFAIIVPSSTAEAIFVGAQGWIVEKFGWLYVAAMSSFLAFAVWLGMGRFGTVRLGKDGERPEFRRISWFAMLFSAGMGIGLLFWSVAEPVYHFTSPPEGPSRNLDAARNAMALTIFHWGFHPWALYAVVALALAYFGFRKGMPLSFRSVFEPLFGERVHGTLGDVIDVLAVVSTLIGVATSLGLGAMQVNAGLNFLVGSEISVVVQIALIGSITALATVSVVLGLDGGIRRLSELNLVLATLLLFLLVVGGGTLFFFNSVVENVGSYFQVLPSNALRTGAFQPDAWREWAGSWTIFYWGWWIAWSPFVGLFIARVSRGRTIREFMAGVLLVPTGVSVVWLTAFGSSALHQELADNPSQNATYPVQIQTPVSLPTDAEGRVIGPRGERYVRNEDGTLRAPDGTTVRPTSDASLVDVETGEPYRSENAGSAPVNGIWRSGSIPMRPVAESGEIIGPDGGLYTRRPDGRLTAPDGSIVRFNPDGALVLAGSGQSYSYSGQPYAGAYAADERPLTVVDYIDEPVLDKDRKELIYSEVNQGKVATALFVLLEGYPLSTIAMIVATTSIILFFVTSSDSASMVIDIIASGGNPDPPVGTRLFWAILEGLVAAVLLLAGGLTALQTASITAALPFTIVLILLCVSLLRGLIRDETGRSTERPDPASA